MMIWRQGNTKPAGRLFDRLMRGLNGGTGLGPRTPRRAGQGAGGVTTSAASPAKPEGVKPTLS